MHLHISWTKRTQKQKGQFCLGPKGSKSQFYQYGLFNHTNLLLHTVMHSCFINSIHLASAASQLWHVMLRQTNPKRIINQQEIWTRDYPNDGNIITANQSDRSVP